MFKLARGEKEKLTEHLLDKVGTNLAGELKTELRIVGYDRSSSSGEYINTLDKIVYDKENKLVGSTDWGIAVLDAGRVAGEYPPFNKIRDWVMYVKEAGKRLTENQITDITWKIMNKIKDKGIDPTWFARRVLSRFRL